MGKYYQKLLTKHLSPLLQNSGIGHLTKPLYGGRGHILMFHRVIPWVNKERIHNHLSLEISPEHLEDIINFFKNRNYHFIDLDLMPAWLQDKNNENKKFVIFTFDDGYKDNLDFAFPVFRKFNVPFTIYITNSFPENNSVLWWYILEKILMENDELRYTFSDKDMKIDCSDYRKKELAFTNLRMLFTRYSANNLEDEISGFFSRYGHNIHELNNEITLGWDEIKQLVNEPLVTIGSHTINHYNLCSLPDEKAFHEISGSKKMIESKINKSVNHFSYPLGSYGLREIELVKKCNFSTSTTTKTANIFHEHVHHLFSLPRISINVLTTEKVLDLQVKGFFPAVTNRLKRVVY